MDVETETETETDTDTDEATPKPISCLTYSCNVLNKMLYS
jgi:hypothetical protein